MKRILILKNIHPVISFDKIDDEMIMTVVGIREGVETQFGKCSMIDFKDGDGEIQSIFMGAALKLFDWNLLVNKKVALVYKGKVKNKATKRQYDDYEVYLVEDETDTE